MKKEMEKEKNIMIMGKFYMKENIKMEHGMDLEMNIIKMVK